MTRMLTCENLLTSSDREPGPAGPAGLKYIRWWPQLGAGLQLTRVLTVYEFTHKPAGRSSRSSTTEKRPDRKYNGAPSTRLGLQ